MKLKILSLKKILILTLFLIYSFNSYSLEESSNSHPYLGVASSVFLGFGSGPIIQNQQKSHAWIYASTQGLGLILLFAGAGSCSDDCSSSSKILRTIGGSLFLGSRLIEIYDSSLYAWSYYKNKEFQAVLKIVPINNGGSLVTTIDF